MFLPSWFKELSQAAKRALAQATEASEDEAEAGQQRSASHGFTLRDVLAGISASGRTPYVLGAMSGGPRHRAALTIGISCTPDSELSRCGRYRDRPASGS
jgi:N-acetylmuramic acid 6-phosphate etherase